MKILNDLSTIAIFALLLSSTVAFGQTVTHDISTTITSLSKDAANTNPKADTVNAEKIIDDFMNKYKNSGQYQTVALFVYEANQASILSQRIKDLIFNAKKKLPADFLRRVDNTYDAVSTNDQTRQKIKTNADSSPST